MNWEKTPVKEKKEIIKMFLDKKLVNYLPYYKALSYEDTILQNKKRQLENALLSLNLYLMTNKSKVSFFKFNLKNLNNFIKKDNQNFYIKSCFLNFEVDKKLNELYKLRVFIRNFSHKEDFELDASDIVSIHKSLENYREPIIKKFNTYLMSDASGLFKIGKAHNTSSRLKSFKTGNPSIKLIAECNSNIENLLHNEFSNNRIIGEWFNLSSDEFIYIINEYKFKIIK